MVLEDLDVLMKGRGIDAILCYGDTTLENPELGYVVRAALPRGGFYVKKRGESPLLVVSGLDLGNARKGVVKDVQTLVDFDFLRLVKEYGRQKAFLELFASFLRKSGVRGRVAMYGRNDVAYGTFVVDELRRRGFKVVGEEKPTILDVVRWTKDEWELSALREVSRKALTVVTKLERLLGDMDLRNGRAFYDGRALTVGEVKRRVRVWCSELGLTLPEDFIFAVGRSSADPHEMGVESSHIRSGEPIVFDIFPKSQTGYWFDFTRTYVLDRPRRELAKMYEEVAEAQRIAFDHLRDGVASQRPMLQVCNHFASKGRLTPVDLTKGNKEASKRGFTHSLGHGIGLTIGEGPNLALFEKAPLQRDMVVTVEPGLYYPAVGGVRIEDPVVVEKGGCRVLAEHPLRFEF